METKHNYSDLRAQFNDIVDNEKRKYPLTEREQLFVTTIDNLLMLLEQTGSKIKTTTPQDTKGDYRTCTNCLHHFYQDFACARCHDLSEWAPAGKMM